MASISSTSATSSTSYNRITGLATGMDTDAMVKQAMQAYKLKVDQAKQARDLQVFKQTLYRDAIKDLRGIFSKYTDIAKPDSLLLTSNYGTSKFTSTNEGAVSAEGLSNAVLGNYKVEVQKVATTAKLEIKDFGKLEDKKITINISGQSVDIDLTGIKVNGSFTNDDMIKKLNSAMKAAGVEGKFSKSDIAGSIILQSTKTGSNQNIEVSSFTDKTSGSASAKYSEILGETLKFKIKGDEISVDLSKDIPENLNDEAKKQFILDRLNSSLAAKGVSAEYEEENIVFTTNTKGDGNSISLTIGNGTKDVAMEDGKTTGYASIYKPLTNGEPEPSDYKNSIGTNALVKITDTYGNTTEGTNGFKDYQSNEITIDGVKFKINDVTTSAVTISGTTDTSKLVDKLKEFVKDYNEVIGKITAQLNEKKNLNYKPLTDEQRENMTDDQIEKWETKVKQGLLKRDNDLTSITSQLRSAFYDSIKGTNLNIKSLGIDFSNDVEKAGQLVIDEAKLSKSLAENSEDVVKLFAQSAPSSMTDKKDIYNNSGIFQRIKTILNTSVMSSASTFLKRVGYEGTSTYTDNDITKDLLKRERQISLMESNLKDRETKLYQKFATLEKVMNNYNSQSSWLTQQFSS